LTADVAIRRATESDLKSIVELLIDDEFGAQRESLDDLTPYLTAFQLIDADPNQLLVVMERDGAIIGTQHLTFMPGLSFQGATRLQIEEVRIASSERGGGLGTILIEWAIEQARERGCNVVQLTSNAARIDAHRFYRRLGFAQSHAGFKLKLR
jgi:GNAT superfamily N-acetyltransferase